jgi:hypothetical protein
MSHRNRDSDRPRKFHDTVGKGKLDSTPIIVPPNFNAETGTSLDLPVTEKNIHPGPFSAAAFHPSSQKFFGLSSRRNTPNDSPERAGRVLMDDKRRDDDRFYKPRIKKIDRNFAKKNKH